MDGIKETYKNEMIDMLITKVNSIGYRYQSTCINGQQDIDIRALASMELNSYIAILAPPKHKNQPTAALVAVELNNYITILAPPKHKNQPTTVELNVFFVPSLVQCTAICGYAL